MRLHCRSLLVVPEIALRGPSDLAAGAAHDQNLADRDILLGGDPHGRIGVLLQRHGLAATHALVAGDHEGRLAIDDPARQGLRRKAAEYDRMDGADAGAGKHGIGRFGDHRHVYCNAVALLDAMLFQDVGKTANRVVELIISDLLVEIGIVSLPDDRRLVAMRFQVAIDAVVGDVSQPVFEPLDRDIALEGRILDLGIGLEPIDSLAMLAPERLRIGNALLVPFQIGLIVEQRTVLGRFQDRVGLDVHIFLPAYF